MDRELLSAYLDDELEPLERAAVERELEASDEARRLLAELAMLDEVARSLPVEAPEGYFDALPGRIRARLQASGRRRSLPTWAWAAAAALAVAALAPLTLGRLEDAGPPDAASPPVTLLDESVAESSGAAVAAAEQTLAEERAERRERSETAALPAATASPPATAQAPAASPRATPSPLRRSVKSEPARPSATGRASPAPGAAASSLPEGFASTPQASRSDARRDLPAEDVAAPPALPPPPEAAGAVDEAEPEEAVTAKRAEVGGEGARNQAASAAPAKRLASSLAIGADAERFTGLAGRRPRTPEGARALREDWRGFVMLYPESALADEARVRTVEAGLEAFRLGQDEADRALARRDAEAYLRRDDAAQPGRVEALLTALER